jgi:hypothetical protein
MARNAIVRIVRGFRLRQWLVLAALLLVLGMTAFYTVRVVRFMAFTRFGEEVPIRGWMSVKYVAHTHHVPVSVLNESIGLPADSEERTPLREIARSQDRSFEELQTALSNAIVEYRASHPPETGGQD